ncbi:Thiosulfate sulfurtransferase, rhodanese [Fimbriiglobus ruber]|uniref:Thiosulfate sulfurtransferase, rhodanese n=2 Tax=Fimbriiglobus ruber TaxID=1908690 RepID=A0A225DF57_9BACT|nr:Thiosulfate sulfurtransferase, rhodanese [Fimbriiglobus ruber]
MLAMLVTARAADEPQKGSPLITQEKLQGELKDATIRLLDARLKAEYEKGHIPGAVWVDTKALQALARPESITNETAWASALAPLGLGADIRVVFIYDNARQHDAARVWWSLVYAGVPRVGLVDGGFDRWTKDKRPVSTEPAKVSLAQFRPQLHDKSLASRDEVGKAESNVLDARSAEEYSGERKSRTNPTAPTGHIPGARNLDSYSLVDTDGQFLDTDSIRRRFAEAGFVTDKSVIAYSAGGNRSAIAIFALERIGVPSRHYVGGFGDWIREAKRTVVQGKNPRD